MTRQKKSRSNSRRRSQNGQPGLKVLPLGGLGEIGMNCMLLEWEDEIIVIDCGVMFGDLGPFGIDFIIPNMGYLMENRHKVRAFIMTHGHEDHIGALPFALRHDIRAPIYASELTSHMVESRLLEAGLIEKTQIRRFKLGDGFQVGSFHIKTVPVNHSIVEAVALIIDTPAGKVIHTGDFRIDSDPFYGNEMRFNEFKKAGDEGVLLLLSDSTNVERDELNDSESVLMKNFDDIASDTAGALFVSMFSSNISRMGQFFQLARKHNRRVTVAGRSMSQNLEIARQHGYLKDAERVYIPQEQVLKIPRKKRLILSTGSQGEYRSALARLAKNEHPVFEIESGDQIIMSSRFIPGNEKSVSRVLNNLFRRGARVHYEPCSHVHVSGHATRPELKKMLQAVRPRNFIPIHGEYRHLVLHAELAEETGVKNSVVFTNGEQIEVSWDGMKLINDFGDLGVLVDSPKRVEVYNSTLSARRKLAERGAMGVLAVVKRGVGGRDGAPWRLVGEPRLLQRGVYGEEIEHTALPEAHPCVERALKEASRNGLDSLSEVEELIRIEVRRYFNQVTGKKPIVFAFAVEV